VKKRTQALLLLFLLITPFAEAAIDNTATGSITAVEGTVEIPTQSDQSSVAVRLSGTWTATVTPELSVDGVNWVATSLYDPATSTRSATVTANGTYQLLFTGGAKFFRVRASAFTSGTISVYLRSTASVLSGLSFVIGGSLGNNQSVNIAQVGGTNTVSGGVAGSLGTGGLAAHNAAPAGNPEQIAGYSWTDGTSPTVTTAGNVTRAINTPEGILAVTDDHPKRFRCTVTVSTATALTAVSGSCAAPGAGLSLYIKHILFSTNAAGIAADSYNTLKYGTGGTCGTGTTTFWSAMTAAATQATVVDPIPGPPIKIPANNEICWINSTAGSKSLVITGYIGP
jgi:hypothetical protein